MKKFLAIVFLLIISVNVFGTYPITKGGGGIPEWQPATTYQLDDLVHESEKFYKSLVTHISSATFPPDLAFPRWIEMSDDLNREAIGTVTDDALVRWDGTDGDDVNDSLVILTDTAIMSGVVGLGNTALVDTDLIIDLISTTKSSRPCPSMTEAQRDALTTITAGCIFNTDTSKLNVYNGSAWKAVGGGIDPWVTVTAYQINDVVHESNKIYLALTNHVSGVFATDLVNNEWVELSDDLNREAIGTVTDNAVIRWDGTGGDDANNSLVIIDDLGALSAPTLVMAPNVSQNITASSDTISSAASHIELTPNADYVLTSTPTITAGVDGQLLMVHNLGTFTISLQDNSVLAGSNIFLGGAESTISPQSTMALHYATSLGGWVVISNPNSASAGATADLIQVRNVSGVAISAGKAVYITGWDVGLNRMTIDLAESDVPGSMPAIGITATAISNGSNGEVITSGISGNINTSTAASGDGVWISTIAGEVVFVRPVVDEIQRIGTVARVNANGQVLINAAERALDVPIVPSFTDFTNSTHNHQAAAGGGTLDHGLALLGLLDDDHTQYVLLVGRATGQNISGGNAASENLTLQSTSNATKGNILFGNSSYDELNNRLGIGVIAPTLTAHIDSNSANTVGILRLENTLGDIDLFRVDATPEGAVIGSIGDMAFDGTGGVIYLKETGTATNTGWARIKGVDVGGLDQTVLTTSSIRTPFNQTTDLGASEVLLETGNDNRFINPSFEHTTVATGWTLVAGASSANTALAFTGDQSIELDMTADTLDFSQSISASGYLGKEIGVQCQISGTAGEALSLCSLLDGVEDTCTPAEEVSVGLFRTFKSTVLVPSIGGPYTIGVKLKTAGAVTALYQVDDCKIVTNISNFINMINKQEIRYDQSAADLVSAIGELRFNLANITTSGSNLLTTSDDGTRTLFTANTEITVHAHLNGRSNAANMGLYLRKNGTRVAIGGDANSADQQVFNQVTLILKSGDNISWEASNGLNSGSPNVQLFIVAEAQVEAAVTNGSLGIESVDYNTLSGFGSTNTKIPYYTNQVTNTANRLISVTNSATLGFAITAVRPCRVTMNLTYSDDVADDAFGITLNSAELSTGVNALVTPADRKAFEYININNGAGNASVTIDMAIGDVLRPHGDSTAAGGNAVRHQMVVTAVPSDFTIISPLTRICYIKDHKPSGTAGGAAVANTVQTRDLNTTSGSCNFLSLVSNQFTISPGLYSIEARTPAWKVDRHQAFLYNVTNSSYDIDGQGGLSFNTDFNLSYSFVRGEINITSSNNYEIREWYNAAQASDGQGIPQDIHASNPQGQETYTTVKITKLR